MEQCNHIIVLTILVRAGVEGDKLEMLMESKFV